MKRIRSNILRYLVAVASVMTIVMLRYFTENDVRSSSPLLFFVIAIFVTAWLGGINPGIFATILSAGIGVFFYTATYNSFYIENTSYIIHTIFFVISGVAISWAIEQLHQAREASDEKTAKLKSEILERQKIDENLAESLKREKVVRAELEIANRTKDEFIATIAHELRTPLNAILGWTQMVSGKIVDESQYAKAFEVIERNAKSQAQLIEDLLDITRITSAKFRLNVKAVQVAPLIENALETIRPSLQAKNITLRTILDSSKDLISGDVDRLQQVVWNLLTNAIKFTPKGGTIEVRLEKIGSYIEIYVIDTGKGIEPEFIPFVFDRFRQQSGTTRIHGGLGIGLSIVRHIVELHGGSVRVESDGVNKGATFIVRLPLRAITEVQKTPSGENEKIVPAVGFNEPVPISADLSGIKIVIVDDEPDARELLSSLLTVYGAEVTACGSVSEALDAVPKIKPNLLISDIGMPRQDGYSLIKKLRELEPENGGQIPAIALTAYTRVEDRVRALSQGFQMFVAKPVEPSELVAAVNSLTNLSINLLTQNGLNHDENTNNHSEPEENGDYLSAPKG